MSNLLVAALVLLYSFQSAFCNLYAKNYPGKKEHSSPVFSVFYGIITAVVTLAFSGFVFAPSKETVILGAVNAAVLVAYNTLLIKASALGPFSIIMIMNLSGGILIPMLWSVLHDGDKLSVFQYIAIAVMLVSFVFLNLGDKNGKEKKSGKVSAKFLVSCILLGVSNGVYGTLLSAQKKLMGGEESGEMIVITFAVSSLLALMLLLIGAKKEALPAFRQNAKSTLALCAASVAAAAAVNVLMHCLSLINVAVLYSLDNGGVLLVSALWSALVLKEKLDRNKIIGLVLAFAAIVALSIL